MTGNPDAIVIGGGHNGLVAAAYLARGGMDTLVVEARPTVGGTASSERFAGATVNICNCDHLTLRTTPVMADLELDRHGLRYLDVEPAQHNTTWDGLDDGRSWTSHHDLAATLDALAAHAPGAVDGYRRYARRAVPAVAAVLEAANESPSVGGLARLALRRRLAGVGPLLSWSRRSAADVLRSFFDDDLVLGPAAATGPMVWGISPEFAGSGLGALTPAMRHVARVGRPVGGSGALTDALRAALESAGGSVMTDTAVAEIRCAGDAVVGVTTTGGDEIDAPVVVSACNPHDTFVRWLRRPPSSASALVERWRRRPHADGYESKLDVVSTEAPRLRGLDASLGPTTVVAPSLAGVHEAHALMGRGVVAERPALLVNVPTLLDPSMAPAGRHVVSIEVLFTPYALAGGWAGSAEPRRWLESFAERCEPGWIDSVVDWRAVTPDRYERDFHLPAGHATSFAGGPLAALRNPAPELTHYDTAVDGLFLTGAATFPGAGVWGASGRNCAGVVLDRHG